MDIHNTKQRKLRPIHPGEILREDFMPDYGLTVSSLAEALGVSRQSINELIRERRTLSPEMANRLAPLFPFALILRMHNFHEFCKNTLTVIESNLL